MSATHDVITGFDFESVGGVSATSGKPFVRTQVRVEGQTIAVGQLTPGEARQMGLQLLFAADTAICDAGLFACLREGVGLPEGGAAALIENQREFRRQAEEADRG